jgi:hypothetical protein
MNNITYTEKDILNILNEGYQPTYFNKYRQIFKQTFNYEAGNCGCLGNQIYNKLKEHYKIK